MIEKTKISAVVVADSINRQGDRLTSMVLTYPRIIHAEMMTHRMFSRNASSSRAVPVKKMIEAVKNNTFCPFEFQKAHKGMQGTEYFTGKDKEECKQLWLESAELALQQAEKMDKKGISKQIINRILEPYQYYTVLITGSKEGWDNFFSLRNPQYTFQNEDKSFKSWKEAIKYHIDNSRKVNVEDVKTLKEYSIIQKLIHNKGQAEIHMMSLAEAIYDAMNESTPKQLQAGEWHIPLEDKIDDALLRDYFYTEEKNPDPSFDEYELAKVKISTAMVARTSYTVVGDEKKIDYSKLLELHDKLIVMRHDSPLEHCARAMSDEEYGSFHKGQLLIEDQGEGVKYISDGTSNGWCRNFRGFIQYRHLIETS